MNSALQLHAVLLLLPDFRCGSLAHPCMGPSFCGAPIQPNMKNMLKSASNHSLNGTEGSMIGYWH